MLLLCNIHESLHLFSPAAGVDANDVEKKDEHCDHPGYKFAQALMLENERMPSSYSYA